MDLHKLKNEEIKTYDVARLREREVEVRRELAKIRMDIYTPKAQQGAKVRGLKKVLARLLTASTAKKVSVKASKPSPVATKAKSKVKKAAGSVKASKSEKAKS